MHNLALSGKLACGKTELAKRMEAHHGFKIISIGTTIKKTCTLLLDDQDEFRSYMNSMLEKSEKSSFIVQKILDAYREKYALLHFEKDGGGTYVKNDSYRNLTQYVATTLRHEFGDDIWVTFIAKEAEILSKKGTPVICDDLRFPSEKQVFENFHFKTVRLDVSEEAQKSRIQKRGDGEISDSQLKHPSEMALDDAEFDLRINTDTMLPEDVKKEVLSYFSKECRI